MNCTDCTTCVFDPSLKAVGLPYEIHVTVEPGRVEQFKDACSLIGVKPLLIDLAVMKDMMTSSVHYGNDTTAKVEMWRIERRLQQDGFRTTRTKIETAPWHPDAPTFENQKQFGAGQYYECHLVIEAFRSPYIRGLLKEICRKHDLHVSKNALKSEDNGLEIVMATLRRSIPLSIFEHRIEKAKSALDAWGFEVKKTIIEFALFDSNVSHDAAWFANDNQRPLSVAA